MISFTFDRQDGNLSSAGQAVGAYLLQCRESEETSMDRSEWNFLQHGVVFDVPETPRVNICRPVLSIHARFKAVSINNAIVTFVLAREVCKTGNPVNTSHIHRDVVGQCQIPHSNA